MKEKSQLSEKQMANLTYFNSKLPEYLKNELYKNKYVVIYEENLSGIYDTFDAALDYALSNYQSNDFIIQQVIDEKDVISFLRSAV